MSRGFFLLKDKVTAEVTLYLMIPSRHLKIFSELNEDERSLFLCLTLTDVSPHKIFLVSLCSLSDQYDIPCFLANRLRYYNSMVEEVIPGNTGLKNVEKTSEFASGTDTLHRRLNVGSKDNILRHYFPEIMILGHDEKSELGNIRKDREN